MLNSINLSIGGVPLIYQGDELGILNDHSYLDDELTRGLALGKPASDR
ncbi:sucrose phosphorylase [Vibrio astriarenae]|nr:sucrose phosphorylase [Vibrio sp. C7]